MTERYRSLEQRYLVRAPPAQVFEALSTPKGLVRWFLASAKLRLEPGSEYTFVWQGGYRHRGQVLAVRPGKSLRLSWPARGLGTSEVEFVLRKAPGGTLLTMRHTRFGRGERWIENYVLTSSGWAYFLGNLRTVLETGKDLRRSADRV